MVTNENAPAVAALGTLIVLAAITALGFAWPAIRRRINRRVSRRARAEFDHLYPAPGFMSANEARASMGLGEAYIPPPVRDVPCPPGGRIPVVMDGAEATEQLSRTVRLLREMSDAFDAARARRPVSSPFPPIQDNDEPDPYVPAPPPVWRTTRGIPIPAPDAPPPGTLQHLTRVSHAVCEAHHPEGVARWWTTWARSTSERRRSMEVDALDGWSGRDAEVGD